jgi:anti-sigma regulatory factor (Ser/Thr protein kinase)
METKTRAADANEFCLVLTPTSDASVRASAAVMERFAMLAEGTRRDLAAVVAELVQSSVDHGPGRPITVTVALSNDAIHGEVSDHGNPTVAPAIAYAEDDEDSGPALLDRLTSSWAVHEGTTDVRFEMPLAR